MTGKRAGQAAAPDPWRRPIGVNQARIGGATPAIHRFRIGTLEAAIVSDGPLHLSDPSEVLSSLPPEVIDQTLDAAFVPRGPMRIEQNCLLLDLGGHLVLFDNGMGSSTLFGREAGRLNRSLAEVGLEPAAIDALVLSHAHADHCWGTMRDDGTPAFPNAQIHMSEAELRFWESCTDPAHESTVAGVHRHLSPLRHRIRFFADGEEFLPGIRALAAPGHTPGHTVFSITSAGNEVCVLSDIVFHDPLSFAYPAATSTYDVDPGLGARTRVDVLGRLADERTRLVSYHAPWPGIGHVVRADDAFRYLPAAIIRVAG